MYYVCVYILQSFNHNGSGTDFDDLLRTTDILCSSIALRVIINFVVLVGIISCVT